MKTIKQIKLFLNWLIYAMLTQDERLRYSRGLATGMHCIKREDVSRIMPGSVTEYTYDRNRKPEREYLTRKEFYQLHLNPHQQ